MTIVLIKITLQLLTNLLINVPMIISISHCIISLVLTIMLRGLKKLRLRGRVNKL